MFTAGEFHHRPNTALAIAHGLEDLYQEPQKPAKKKRGKKKEVGWSLVICPRDVGNQHLLREPQNVGSMSTAWRRSRQGAESGRQSA